MKHVDAYLWDHEYLLLMDILKHANCDREETENYNRLLELLEAQEK